MTTAVQTLKSEWDQSYSDGDNAIYYPKEELVKFLNRHVRKRRGLEAFEDVLIKAPGDTAPWRGLDFGCGIARHAILLEEFGFEGYGIDISAVAIEHGRELAAHLGFGVMRDRIRTTCGTAIEFEDAFFDVTLCVTSLDCMSFDIAKPLLHEIDRVTKYLAYVTLYSGDIHEHHREFAEDVAVGTPPNLHTVRSYYNWSKIQALLAGTRWQVRSAHMLKEESLISPYEYARYYLVLEK